MNDAFEKKHGTSRTLAERAKGILAGGVSGEFRAASPFPVFIDRAEGARKWDADGNEFIDYSMGSAALMLGHAHPAVVEVVQRAAGRGTSFVLRWRSRSLAGCWPRRC